jgi:hypothetical protein
MRAGCDIEENHFIGALLIVSQRQSYGIADIAQFAGLGSAELNAAGNLTCVDVQAGYDSSRHHQVLLKRVVGPEANFFQDESS